MPDPEIEFEAETPPSSASGGPLAVQEQGLFAKSEKENSVVIPLWKGGYISFNPQESVSIFALLALVLLLGATFIITTVGIWVGDAAWMDKIATALGHATTGVVGAIVGSAASKKK